MLNEKINPFTPNAAFDRLIICLLTFSADFFCLSAAQNAPPAGGRPDGGAFCAADKQKKCAEKVNKLGTVTVQHFYETVGN